MRPTQWPVHINGGLNRRGAIKRLRPTALLYRVPAINWSRSFAEGGGLISYGPYLADEFRRAATYADRILKGEKPAELPVQAPIKYEMVINRKSANALDLIVPNTLLVAADEVIE
jgi:ABC-type uncharacterized transport system substrate-binding protein